MSKVTDHGIAVAVEIAMVEASASIQPIVSFDHEHKISLGLHCTVCKQPVPSVLRTQFTAERRRPGRARPWARPPPRAG